MKRLAIPSLAVPLILIALAAPPPARAEEAPAIAPQKSVVVHLTAFTNDLHKALMAVKLAWGMQHRGAKVTLFLDIEGVRIADKRQPIDLKWGTSGSLEDHWDTFIAEGGRVLLCRHCAHAAGIESEHLREGAALDEDELLPQLLIDADVVLDY